MTKPGEVGPYSVFMLALSLFALGLLAYHTIVKVEPGTAAILGYADTLVCAFFFLDFLSSFFRAPKKGAYFLRWGWLDLLSSIPLVDNLRWGRTARVVRILRVLRGIKSTKILAGFVLKRRAEGTFLAATLVAVILVTFASIAILQFETAPEATIRTPEDAFWWSIVTITTVGYGDRYPISSEGRVIAVFLMLAGVGLFGTLSGFVAAWFIEPEQHEQESEIQALAAEVRRLREALEARHSVEASGYVSLPPLDRPPAQGGLRDKKAP